MFKNKTANTVLNIILIIAILNGLVFVGVGMLFNFLSNKAIEENNENLKNNPAVEATIEMINEKKDGNEITFEVIVLYDIDGERYHTELGYYDFRMKEGDSVEIHYNPENPEEIYTEGVNQTAKIGLVVSMIAIIAGGSVIAVSIIIFIISISVKIRRKREESNTAYSDGMYRR